MGRCMGESSLTLRPDGFIFDLDYHFPPLEGEVGVSLSAGIESTILLAMLVKRYGKNRVRAFTGLMHGRREWESKNALQMSLRMGVLSHYTVDADFSHMSVPEARRLLTTARELTEIQSWFTGTSKLLYHPMVFNKESAAALRQHGIYLPFIELEKKHTVDLYYHMNVEHLLPVAHSCTMRGDIHCGTCVCCNERVRGFYELGLVDPATYSCDWSTALKSAGIGP